MGRTDRASLLLHVDPGTAWTALTTEDALRRWLPPAGMHGRFDRFDLRTGGSYRLVLTYADAAGAPGRTTADSDASEVRVVEVVPGERVVQEVDLDSTDPAFAGTMRMTWRLRAVAEGTEVEIEARDVPPGVSAQDHAAGITSSLANLAAYLES